MKQISLKFKKLEIARTFPRDNSVEIKLIVNDGKDKVFSRSVKLDNTADAACELVKEVREKVKSANPSTKSSDDILSGIVVVKMCDDEDTVIEKMTRFFTNAREKFRAANGGKMSYYDLEMKIKREIVEF